MINGEISAETMLLMLFSEWLDADMHLIATPPGDEMTHHDLVTLFQEFHKTVGGTQFKVERVE